MIRDADPGISVTTKIVEGIPDVAIVEEAQSWNADLIAFGSHGYDRRRRVVLGSVARAVAAMAFCSVQLSAPSTDRARWIRCVIAQAMRRSFWRNHNGQREAGAVCSSGEHTNRRS